MGPTRGSRRLSARRLELLFFQLAEEAAVLSGVAGGPCLVYDIEQRVVVAVHQHAPHLLDVAGGLPLLPELVPAPAPIRRELRLHRLLDRLAVRICQHQDLAGLRLLGDDRDQPVPLSKVDLVELRCLQSNSLTLKPENGEGNKPYFITQSFACRPQCKDTCRDLRDASAL